MNIKTKTYKNITRFSLPIIVKTADGARTTSFTLPPQKTFDITETQITGDVLVKTQNRLLQLVSEETSAGSTTEFPKVVRQNISKPQIHFERVKEKKSKVDT
jgi:hypothetical protein